MLVRYVCHEREGNGAKFGWLEGEIEQPRNRCWGGERVSGRGWLESWRKTVAVFTGSRWLEKLFRRWLLNGRRSFDELRCPVSRCSDLLDTRMLLVPLLPSLFLFFFFFFASSFSSFSVFLSAPVLNFLLFLSFFLSFFFSFYPIHRKFIEHHFPTTFPTTKV